jgi:hypothetical protein
LQAGDGQDVNLESSFRKLNPAIFPLAGRKDRKRKGEKGASCPTKAITNVRFALPDPLYRRNEAGRQKNYRNHQSY